MNKYLRLLMCAVFALNVNVAWADDDELEYTDDAVVAEEVVDTDADTTDVAEAESDDDTVATASQRTDAPTVSARMDCATMKAKISELTASGDDEKTLKSLRKQYRKECVARSTVSRAARRMTNVQPAVKTVTVESGAPSVQQKPDVVVISDAQKTMCERIPDKLKIADAETRDTLQATFDEYCNKNVVASDAVINTTMLVLGPEETEEEKNERIAANLDAGLCGDGTKPNKYGCCTGEVFKEIGDLQFACCPEDGGTCFPPIK